VVPQFEFLTQAVVVTEVFHVLVAGVCAQTWAAPEITRAAKRTGGRNRFLISLKILEREIALFVQRDLFVADQRDGGVGGGGTGGGSSRLLDPLRLCAGDTEHPNQPDEE
jgi:hypothetical protein